MLVFRDGCGPRARGRAAKYGGWVHLEPVDLRLGVSGAIPGVWKGGRAPVPIVKRIGIGVGRI